MIYVHKLSPFIFQAHFFGQTFGLRWYGLAYVLGLVAAFWAFRVAARRGLLPNLDADAQQQMIFALATGVVGGGRIGYVVQHLPKFFSDPLFLLRVWEGGMTFFGGLAGVALALVWAKKRFDLNFWTLADVAAFSAAFGLGVGRVANFINGELIGRPTGESWGVIFPRVDNLPRHPSQLYEAVSHFLLLGVLLALLKMRPQLIQEKPGVFAAIFLLLYGALRFATDFYRADDTFLGPFSSGQWASLVVAALGIWLLRARISQPIFKSPIATTETGN
jgi:phosphatidylglycerol:prolipoprotein diacylglycerol transferase